MANAQTVSLQAYLQCPREMFGLELGEVTMGTATQAGKSGAKNKVVQGLEVKSRGLAQNSTWSKLNSMGNIISKSGD